MAEGMRVIRSSGSLQVWLLGTALGVLALLDLALGDRSALLHVAAPVLLVIWLLGLVLARPSIGYDASGLVVVNPGVVHEVPWAAVEDIARGHQIVLVLAEGRITAWGSPPLPRRRPLRKEVRTDWAFAEISGAWEQARANRTATGAVPHVVRRPDVPALVTGAVLVVATVLTALL